MIARLPELSSVRSEPTYELVARAIEKKILDGLIAHGDVLPSETAFAAQLGVNRSTLREALRALEQNGLVHREPGRKKLRVSAPRTADLSRRFASAMLHQQVSFEELYEAMRASSRPRPLAPPRGAIPGCLLNWTTIFCARVGRSTTARV